MTAKSTTSLILPNWVIEQSLLRYIDGTEWALLVKQLCYRVDQYG